MKKLLVLRSVPGAGKSYYARRRLEECWDIQVQIPGTTGDEYQTSATGRICSADDYFIRPDGVYDWNPKLLKNAHEYCRNLVEKCMMGNDDLLTYYPRNLIIVDNTNIKKSEYQPYLDLASKYGYEVEVKVIGSFDKESLLMYAKRNKHGVPVEKVLQMGQRFEH